MCIYGEARDFSRVRLHNRTICLPVTSSGEIDWQYMQERIAELEHYLVASGLNDYELTEEDKSILATELFNGDDAMLLDILVKSLFSPVMPSLLVTMVALVKYFIKKTISGLLMI